MPTRLGSVHIAAECFEEWEYGPLLQPLWEFVAGEGLVVHERVEIRVFASPRPIRRRDAGQGVVRVGDNLLEHLSLMCERLGDQGDLHLSFLRYVFVEGRGLDAELGSDGPHREAVPAVSLEEPACSVDDLIATARGWPTSSFDSEASARSGRAVAPSVFIVCLPDRLTPLATVG